MQHSLAPPFPQHIDFDGAAARRDLCALDLRAGVDRELDQLLSRSRRVMPS